MRIHHMISRLRARTTTVRMSCFLGTAEALFYTSEGGLITRIQDPKDLSLVAVASREALDIFLVSCQGLITRLEYTKLTLWEQLVTFWGLRRATKHHKGFLKRYGRVICYSPHTRSTFQESCLDYLRTFIPQARVYDWTLSISSSLYTRDAHGVVLDAPDGTQYIHTWHNKAPVLTRICRDSSMDQNILVTKSYLDKAHGVVPQQILHQPLDAPSQWPRTVCLEKWGTMAPRLTQGAWGLTALSLIISAVMGWQMLAPHFASPSLEPTKSPLQDFSTPLPFDEGLKLMQALSPTIVPVMIHYTPTKLILEAMHADGQEIIAQTHIARVMSSSILEHHLQLYPDNRLTLEIFRTP